MNRFLFVLSVLDILQHPVYICFLVFPRARLFEGGMSWCILFNIGLDVKPSFHGIETLCPWAQFHGLFTIIFGTAQPIIILNAWTSFNSSILEYLRRVRLPQTDTYIFLTQIKSAMLCVCVWTPKLSLQQHIHHYNYFNPIFFNYEIHKTNNGTYSILLENHTYTDIRMTIQMWYDGPVGFLFNSTVSYKLPCLCW
jgi:hypothetical protein